MNYTKGEWKATYHESGNKVQGGLAGYSIQSREAGIAYNISQEDNAHLISAAPEMYEALQKISYAVMNGNLKVNKSVAIQIYEIATPALAKAEGKES